MRRLFSPVRSGVLGPVKRSFLVSPFFVKRKTRFTHIYHCTVYRTGSQWLRRIFSDWRVARYSGLRYEFYYQRICGPDDFWSNDARFPFSSPFQPRRIVTIYASHDQYERIPKVEPYTTFFVLRDPRDIVVSYYFFSRSCRDNGPRGPLYHRLESPVEGLSATIEVLEKIGVFAALRSWMELPMRDDPHVRLIRFEDLIGANQLGVFQSLFASCDLILPDKVLTELLAAHTFKKLTGGRRQGEEDVMAHHRKGIIGDWKNYFLDDHIAQFKAVTGDLINITGYTW
ncbi:Sulfotransferase [Gammaproteobacteria bacterium]